MPTPEEVAAANQAAIEKAYADARASGATHGAAIQAATQAGVAAGLTELEVGFYTGGIQDAGGGDNEDKSPAATLLYAALDRKNLPFEQAMRVQRVIDRFLTNRRDDVGRAQDFLDSGGLDALLLSDAASDREDKADAADKTFKNIFQEMFIAPLATQAVVEPDPFQRAQLQMTASNVQKQMDAWRANFLQAYNPASSDSAEVQASVFAISNTGAVWNEARPDAPLDNASARMINANWGAVASSVLRREAALDRAAKSFDSLYDSYIEALYEQGLDAKTHASLRPLLNSVGAALSEDRSQMAADFRVAAGAGMDAVTFLQQRMGATLQRGLLQGARAVGVGAADAAKLLVVGDAATSVANILSFQTPEALAAKAAADAKKAAQEGVADAAAGLVNDRIRRLTAITVANGYTAEQESQAKTEIVNLRAALPSIAVAAQKPGADSKAIAASIISPPPTTGGQAASPQAAGQAATPPPAPTGATGTPAGASATPLNLDAIEKAAADRAAAIKQFGDIASTPAWQQALATLQAQAGRGGRVPSAAELARIANAYVLQNQRNALDSPAGIAQALNFALGELSQEVGYAQENITQVQADKAAADAATAAQDAANKRNAAIAAAPSTGTIDGKPVSAFMTTEGFEQKQADEAAAAEAKRKAEEDERRRKAAEAAAAGQNAKVDTRVPGGIVR